VVSWCDDCDGWRRVDVSGLEVGVSRWIYSTGFLVWDRFILIIINYSSPGVLLRVHTVTPKPAKGNIMCLVFLSQLHHCGSSLA